MALTIFAHRGVAWKLNTPSAHRHGGSWKRLVRNVKRVLYDMLGSTRFTEEVLGATLCLVEQALDSSPTTPVKIDSSNVSIKFILVEDLIPGEVT